MKELTPNTIALRISFFVSVVVSLAIFFVEYFNSGINKLLLLIVFPVTFTASYVSFRFVVEKFIYRKIKLIYRTIHKLKLGKGEKNNKFDFNTDVLNQVKDEVELWDKTNQKEIDRLKDLKNYQREFVGNVSHELKTPIF